MPQAEIQALNQKIDNSAFERAQQIQRDAPPWQSDAVLCGPFNPKAAPPTQIHQGSVARWRRYKLHVQRRKQGLPAESGAVQAVVLPSKELRNIAAALVSSYGMECFTLISMRRGCLIFRLTNWINRGLTF